MPRDCVVQIMSLTYFIGKLGATHHFNNVECCPTDVITQHLKLKNIKQCPIRGTTDCKKRNDVTVISCNAIYVQQFQSILNTK